MKNIWGNTYTIRKNDIPVKVNGMPTDSVIFNVVEKTRKINFKKAQPAKVDTAETKPLPIKVLSGKIFENKPEEERADKDALPNFNLEPPPSPVMEQVMVPGKFYIIAGEGKDKAGALAIKKILDEQRISNYLGFDQINSQYFIYTNYYSSRAQARKELERLRETGVKILSVMEYK
jgi:hypothetical protein